MQHPLSTFKKISLLAVSILLAVCAFNACSDNTDIKTTSQVYFFTDYPIGVGGWHLRFYTINSKNDTTLVDSLLKFFPEGTPTCDQMITGTLPSNKTIIRIGGKIGDTIHFYAEVGHISNPLETWDYKVVIPSDDCYSFKMEK